MESETQNFKNYNKVQDLIIKELFAEFEKAKYDTVDELVNEDYHNLWGKDYHSAVSKIFELKSAVDDTKLSIDDICRVVSKFMELEAYILIGIFNRR